jgi:putative multicomponent Na+:H+ antiporter subunit B
MIDSYVYAIVALLPLSALMVIIQTNPYQALVIRGILGAMAALVYAVLGGADVALTEALVGTMLAVTLVAVAVRSSLVMRLGVLETDLAHAEAPLHGLVPALRAVLKGHYLRLEMVPYANSDSLAQSLKNNETHGIYQVHAGAEGESLTDAPSPVPQMWLRVPRLYDILTAELPPHLVQLRPMPVVDSPQKEHPLATLTEKPQ